jgi:sigma-B regulation protein RsbU (phosphoserine phosphatase)
MEEATYEEVPVRIEPGETILFTSDGTTDAIDPRGRFYDESRLSESLRSSATRDTAQLTKDVCRRIIEFTGGAELNDDVTILALRRT